MSADDPHLVVVTPVEPAAPVEPQPVEPLSARMRRGRMTAIDVVFGEADRRPVYVAAGVAALIWLIVLIWLTGFPAPWSGERGPMVIPAGAETETGLGAAAGNSAFQWAAFLRGDAEPPEGLPPYPSGSGQERAWLDRHVCGPFSQAQSTPASRAAVAWRIKEANGLCVGVNGLIARARLAPGIGAGAGLIVSGLVLLLIGAALGFAVHALSRVRDAYRRLYVSHHRPDPEGR